MQVESAGHGFKDVTVYRGRKGGANTVVAHLPGVEYELFTAAYEIHNKAAAILASRHGRTRNRFHNLPRPYMTIERGKKLDWFVMLNAEAESEGAALQRAIGIEFGHHYQDRDKNSSGPWGGSGGLGVLADAIGATKASRWQ